MSAPLDQLKPRGFNVRQTARLLGFIPDEDLDNEVKIARAADRVRKLIRKGKLRARNLGKEYLVYEKEIDRFLEADDEPIRHPDSVAS